MSSTRRTTARRMMMAVFCAVATAATAVAPTEASPADRDDVDTEAPGIDPADVRAALADARATSGAATSTGARQRFTTCRQPRLVDRRGDGLIDIVGVSIDSNCSQWAFRVETAREFGLAAGDLMIVQIDSDMKRSTGCGGTDRIAAVVATSRSSFVTEAYETRGCDRDSWRAKRTPSLGVGEGVTVTVGPWFGLRSAFGWFAGTYSEGEDEGADFAPNRTWQIATFPPSRVRDLRVETADGGVEVTWKWPESTFGMPITGYRVSISGRGETRTTTVRPPTRRVRFDGLSTGFRYRVSVVAENLNSESRPVSKSFTADGAPNPPRSLVVGTRDAPRYRLTWKAPKRVSVPIVRYEATMSTAGAEPVVLELRDPLATNVVLPTLEPGRTYEFSVISHDGRSASVPRTVTFVVPPA